MPGERFFADLGPYARLATAVGPFAAAMLLRLIFGRTRLIGYLISLSTMWFLVNVLIAPFSLTMQQELLQILH